MMYWYLLETGWRILDYFGDKMSMILLSMGWNVDRSAHLMDQPTAEQKESTHGALWSMVNQLAIEYAEGDETLLPPSDETNHMKEALRACAEEMKLSF